MGMHEVYTLHHPCNAISQTQHSEHPYLDGTFLLRSLLEKHLNAYGNKVLLLYIKLFAFKRYMQ